jgi:hypothetical protein
MMRLLIAIGFGVGAGYAATIPPSPFAVAPPPRFRETGSGPLPRLFTESAIGGAVRVATAPDTLDDAEEPGTWHSRWTRDGMRCPSENDCIIQSDNAVWHQSHRGGDERCTQIRPRLVAGAPKGLMIGNIPAGSIYGDLGFREGDVLLSVNGVPLGDVSQKLEPFRALHGKRSFWVEVERDGKRVWKTYRLE